MHIKLPLSQPSLLIWCILLALENSIPKEGQSISSLYVF